MDGQISYVGRMYESPRHLEGIAKEVHDKTGIARPVDAFRLAELCGLAVRFWSGRHGKIDGKTIFCPASARLTRQHRITAHEVAHWLLQRAGCDDRDEGAADYLALALLLLRAPFERDLAEGLEMVEEKARYDLGMVKRDEILVQLSTTAAK